MDLKNRAYNKKKKKAILNRLLKVWNKYGDGQLRLGQLIYVAMKTDVDLFYIEDQHFIDEIENLYTRGNDESKNSKDVE